MTALPDDEVPAYRLFDCEQAAKRAGGGLTKNTFYRLARTGEVEFTDMGGRTLWTDEQIAAAVAYNASRGRKRKSSPSPRESARPVRVAEQRRGNVAPLVDKPGRRYADATR